MPIDIINYAGPGVNLSREWRWADPARHPGESGDDRGDHLGAGGPAG
jgi:hypothetical protein